MLLLLVRVFGKNSRRHIALLLTGAVIAILAGGGAGLVLGLVHDGHVALGVGDDPVIAAGDRLLVARKATGAPRE